MKLKTPLIASLLVAALAVPVASATVLTLSTTPAFAKNGKSNGKGGQNRSSGRKSKPDKPARGSSQRGGGNGFRQTARGNSAAAKPAALATEVTATDDTALRPSQLGSMNGALHANINAVLAHIRNGNGNGPVGALATLAVADANAEGAQDLLDRADSFATIDAALADTEYDTLEDYQAAVAAGEIDPITEIDAAVAALGDTIDAEAPSEEEIADAQAALDAQIEAESGILDAWNKSDEADDGEQDALFTALRDRLAAESDAIAETIETLDLTADAGDATDPDASPDEVVVE